MLIQPTTVNNPQLITPAAAPLGVHQDGEALRFNASGTSITGTLVDLELPLTYSDDGSNFTDSWWYAARLTGQLGLRPTIRLRFVESFQTVKPSVHNAFWTYTPNDPASWQLFENENYTGTHTVEVQRNDPFTQDEVYIAHYPIYYYTRMASQVGEWMQSPYVGELSDTTNGVFDTFPQITDPLDGRTIPQLDAYGFKLTEGTGDKNIATFTTTCHANESLGTWAFEGAIEFLLSNDPQAQSLRQNFEFYVWPTIDASGQYAGYYRSTPHQDPPLLTMNRDWDVASVTPYAIHRSSFAANLPVGEVDVVVDWHCYNSTGSNGSRNFFYGTDNPLTQNFASTLQNYDSGAGAELSIGTSQNTRRYLRDEYGTGANTTLGVTPETSCLRNRGLADWKQWGEWICRAIEDRYQLGDFTYGP